MKRLLVLSPSVPFPADDGVKLRLSNLLRRMPDGWTVDLVCFDRVEQMVEERPDNGLCERLIRVPLPTSPSGWRGGVIAQSLRPEPTMIWKFRAPAMTKLVAERSQNATGVLAVGLQMAQYLSAAPRGVVTALDNYNVESRILARMADTRSGLKQLYWRWEATKLLHAERRLLRAANTVFAISDVDRDEMTRMAAGLHSDVLPMGIDYPYFAETLAPAAGDPVRFTFTGAFNWHVNEDAAQWLAGEVWPLVRSKVPGAELHLVGRAPGPSLLALQNDPSVHVSGTVPDVRPYMGQSSAMLVPLRYGSGVRTKILEAFAAGRPVISTPVGCEGLPVNHREHLLVAQGAPELAAACIEIATDTALANRLAITARKFVTEWDQRSTQQTRGCLLRAFAPGENGRGIRICR